MDYFIECPVCEQHFKCSVDSPAAQVKCPGCSRRFELSSAVKLGTSVPMAKKSTASEKAKRLALPATKVPAPDGVKVPASDDVKVTEEAGVTGGSKQSKPKIEGESDAIPIKSVRSKPLTAQRLLKKKRKQRKVFLVIGLLGIIIGILSALLILQLQKNPIGKTISENNDQAAPTANENTKDASAVDGSSSRIADSSDGTDSPGNSDVEKEPASGNSAPAKRIRLDDLEPLKYVFHSEDEVIDCWEMVHPHLVSLTVHDASGKHQAVGTIIDSRGWIVTSYSAIKGASKIAVTDSVKTIDELPKPDLLTDVVRGVIKLDSKQDLAVLSINRRFVDSFVDIKMTKNFRVVEGEYLIQSTPPSELAPYARQESKMAICDKLTALSANAQQLAKSRELEAPELNWIVCPDKQNTIPGSPLIRIDGTFEAINVFAENDLSYYVSIEQLSDLVADASDKPKPLAVLGGASMDGETVGVETTHPMREASVEMNKLAKKCQSFNWIPKNESDYVQLQKFAQQYVDASEFIKKHKKDDPELTTEIKTQTDQFRNTILKTLREKIDFSGMKQANELAGEELKKPNRVVPFFAKVFELEISAGSDILALDQTENFVALAKDDTRKPFQRDAECLVFVRTQGNPSKMASYRVRDEKVPASRVDLISRFNISK